MLKETKKYQNLKLALCAAFLSTSVAHAGDGAIKSLTDFDVNDTSLFKSMGIEVGGWVEVGIAGNPDDPDSRTNGPVTFNDRSNEFNMHELYFYIEKAVNEGDEWDFGFRADILYGTDARFSPTSNLDGTLIGDDEPLYKLVFPQTYVDIYAPVGNGLTATIGHFYTIIGNEVVTAPDNFFFSHAYTMQYGEPFTHTGALFNYHVTDSIDVKAGVVSGWDSFFQEPANFLGGVSWGNDTTSAAFSLITGDVEKGNEHNRTMYSIVVAHDFMDELHYTIQHDFGVEEQYSAKWYGINQYLTYDINDEVAAGIRFEWFRDEGGTRVGLDDHYFAFTAGVNYQPLSWLMIRPEIRYDWTDKNNAFNDGKSDDQVLISADAIIMF